MERLQEIQASITEAKELMEDQKKMIYVNSDDHYCHSMKAHDSDSPATCLDEFCGWRGIRANLIEKKS